MGHGEGGKRKLLKSVNGFKHKGENGSESGLKLMKSDESKWRARASIQGSRAVETEYRDFSICFHSENLKHKGLSDSFCSAINTLIVYLYKSNLVLNLRSFVSTPFPNNSPRVKLLNGIL